MKKLICTFFVLVLTSVSANAQGNNADFSGPYIGGTVGYSSLSADGLSKSTSGASFGGLFGFRNEVSDGVYVGVEGFLDFNTASQDFLVLGQTVKFEVDESYGVVAQAGFAAGQALFFANAGYGWTNVSASAAVAGTSIVEDSSSGGVRLGAGVEYKINENLAVRVQGNWQDYSGGSSTGGTGGLVLSF